MTTRAVIVFSGGQDSTTCLIHALPMFDEIHCITFDYGQRHRAEIEVARQLSKQLGVKVHKVLDTSLLNEPPLDVLHETAAYRIRTATQLLESFACGEGVHSELARVLVTSLRDGCDLLDVVGRRLQGQVSA